MDREIESAAVGIALSDGSELDFMKPKQFADGCTKLVQKTAVFITTHSTGLRGVRFARYQ